MKVTALCTTTTATYGEQKLLNVGGIVDINKYDITIETYTDYKDNPYHISSMGYRHKDFETMVNTLYTEIQQKYPRHNIIVKDYTVHIDKHLPLVNLLIQKFGDNISFVGCNLVEDHKAPFFSKRPDILRSFTKEWFLNNYGDLSSDHKPDRRFVGTDLLH